MKGRSGESSAVEISDFINFIADMDVLEVLVSSKKFS